MLKKFAIIFFALFSGCLIPKDTSFYPHQEKQKQFIEGLFQKRTAFYLSGNEEPVGSGVTLYLGPNQAIIVLTACHVVRLLEEFPGSFLSLEEDPNFFYPYEIERCDEKKDLALVKTTIIYSGHQSFSTKLAVQETFRGEDVWVIGSPNGIIENVSKGIISSKIKRKGVLYYRTDAAIYFGNSGGGVYNFLGKLIGIVAGIQVENGATVPGSGILVSNIEILKFMRKDKK